MADERLPDFLYGTFMQYKQHTGVVRDWLLGNASGTIKQRFGLIPINIGDNNEQESDYNTTVGPTLRPTQYLPITRNIPQSPRPTISAGLIQSLRTSIDLRDECVAYFAGFTHPDIVAKNRTHVYFVNVLRQVLRLLLPHQTAESSPAMSTSVADRSQTDLAEQVASVVLEDPEHEADKATSEHLQLDEGLIDEDPLTIGHGASQNHSYQLQFARQCYLKDLDRLYDFIKEKWHDHSVGRREPVTASTLTEVALDMVLRLEETYLRSIGINKDDTEAEILSKELNELQQCSALSQSESQQLGTSEGGVFSFQRSYQLAKCLVRNMTLAYAEELTSGFGGIRHGIPRGLADPDLLIDTSDTPTDSDFAAKLSELEHAFKDPLAPCVGPHACCGLVEDQILSIVRVAFVRTRVRMSTTFAVSIFLLVRQYAALDVRRVAVPDAQPLLAEVDAAAREVRSFWNRESNITKAFNKAANDNEKRPAKTDYQIRICNFATGILNGNSRQEPKQYLIQTNLRQYLGMSPLACGLVVAWFKIRQNWESFLSIDQRQTVLFMLHFYTAAKQGEDLKETWEDMEYLIEAHGTVKLFHGDRPQTYEESISQLRLSFGMALDLSKMYEGRGATKKSTKQSNGPKISDAFTQGTMPILQLLSRRRPQYDISENEKTGLQDIELALSGINSNRPNSVRLTPEGRLANRPELFKLYDRTAKRTPVEFLKALQKQIEVELRNLSFDYGALERRCWELLDGMRAAMKKAGLKIEDYNGDKSKPLSDRHLYQLTEYIVGLPLVEFADTNTGLGLQQRMDSDMGFAEVQKYKEKYLTLVARMADFIQKRGDMGVKGMREADD